MEKEVFIPILKVDAAKREVHGVMAEEARDKTNEIFDYESSKPYVQAWSEHLAKLSDGASLGNVRGQHGRVAAGKLVSITFDDATKTIPVVAKITDNNEWEKVQDRTYNGFSIGGSYIRKWGDGTSVRYTVKPIEVSIVDNPAMYGAKFTMVKADGTTEEQEFQHGVTLHVPAHLQKQAEAAIAKVMEENSVEKEEQMSVDLKKVEDLAKAIEAQGLEIADLKKMSAENQAHLHGMLIHHAGMGSHLEKMHASCAKMAGAPPAAETEAEKAARVAREAEAAKSFNASGAQNAELTAFKTEVNQALTNINATLTALGAAVTKMASQPANSSIVSGTPMGETGKTPAAEAAATGGKFNPQGVEKADVAGAALAKALENGVRVDTVRK